MNKIIYSFAMILGALLSGCADSNDYNQGSAAKPESGSSDQMIQSAAAEPAVAEKPANKSPETQFNTLGSAATPSANVPANVSTSGTSTDTDSGASAPSAQPVANEQGAQSTPEPNTGDDQNPDQIKPSGK